MCMHWHLTVSVGWMTILIFILFYIFFTYYLHIVLIYHVCTWSMIFDVLQDGRSTGCFLCFIVSKYSKTDVKTLSSALFDFYSTDILSEAKKRLLGRQVEFEVKMATHFSPAWWRWSATALDSLPKYVSGSPDNMPSLHLYQCSYDITTWVIIIEFGSALAAFTHDVHTLKRAISPESIQRQEPVINTTSTTADCNAYNYGQCGLSVGFKTAPGVTLIVNPPQQWVGHFRFQLRSAVEIILQRCQPRMMDEQPQQPFTNAVHSRRTKWRQCSLSSKQQQQQRQEHPQQSSAATQQQSQTASTQRGLTPLQQPGSRVRNCVFCVDNVVTSCTVDDIHSPMAGLNVEIISCFKTKPRRHPHEWVNCWQESVSYDNRQHFLNPLWAGVNLYIWLVS